MSLGEGLGRLFDVEPGISQKAATVKPVSLKDAGGVTFICWVPGGGGDTFIVKQGPTAGGSFAAFNPISRYYTKSAQDGTVQWVDSGDLASLLGTIVLLSGELAFYVGADDLAAADAYVEVVPGTSGVVTAILHDLEVQRQPSHLRAPNA